GNDGARTVRQPRLAGRRQLPLLATDGRDAVERRRSGVDRERVAVTYAFAERKEAEGPQPGWGGRIDRQRKGRMSGVSDLHVGHVDTCAGYRRASTGAELGGRDAVQKACVLPGYIDCGSRPLGPLGWRDRRDDACAGGDAEAIWQRDLLDIAAAMIGRDSESVQRPSVSSPCLK